MWLGVEEDAAQIAGEVEVVLWAYLPMVGDDSLQHPCAVVDSLVALHRARALLLACCRGNLLPQEAMRLDASHDLVDLGLDVLIDQLEVAPQEAPALADFADYRQYRL